jgi:hypothetical protein
VGIACHYVPFTVSEKQRREVAVSCEPLYSYNLAQMELL